MLGILTVQTDWDFSIEFMGEIYSDYEFTLEINDIKELNEMIILGPFGTPKSSDTKCWEFESGIKRIQENPQEEFDTTGGNRGVCWTYLVAKLEHSNN